MDTLTRHPDHSSVQIAAPEAVYATPERAPTCGHCHYNGPLQVRYTYPLMVRWYVIAAGFAFGILPGILLLSWRRSTPPIIATTCPLCLFLRLEPGPVPKS